MKCRSPTLSEDSGKHSAPSVHSDHVTTSLSNHSSIKQASLAVVEIRKNKGECLGVVFATGLYRFTIFTVGMYVRLYGCAYVL